MTSTLNDILSTSTTTDSISIGGFIICIIAALLMGVILSFAIQYKSIVSKSFAVTVAILPPVVCVVIMMVNGSIGAGIAVAGTFSLVRFRSVPGTAREILSVFVAMAIGLACGMGNIVYGLIFTAITIIAILILENTKFGELNDMSKNKLVRITIPEDLDYTEIFEDLFEDYTSSHKLTMVKTTNLGSMFKLSYDVILRDPYEEKEFIDKLRVRNGNLEISCSMMPTVSNEL
jgi:hypothetical protein